MSERNGSRISVAYIVGGLLMSAAGLWMGTIQADVRAAAQAAQATAVAIEQIRGEMSALRAAGEERERHLARWRNTIDRALAGGKP